MATPAITILDPSNVLIDGSNAGQIMDVVRNHPQLASDVQNAFAAWHASNAADQGDEIKTAIETAIADATAKLATAQEAAKAAEAKAAADLQAAKDAVAVQLAALQADADAKAATIKQQVDLIDVLGGTELGKKMAAEKRAKELQDTIDAATVEMEKIKAEVDKVKAADDAELAAVAAFMADDGQSKPEGT